MFDLPVESCHAGVFVEFYVGLYLVRLIFFALVSVFVLVATNLFEMYRGFHVGFCFVDGKDDGGVWSEHMRWCIGFII